MGRQEAQERLERDVGLEVMALRELVIVRRRGRLVRHCKSQQPQVNNQMQRRREVKVGRTFGHLESFPLGSDFDPSALPSTSDDPEHSFCACAHLEMG